MAKPLGPKALLIRKAIHDHPDKGNTAIAELVNDSNDRMDDKIKVTANDVAAQKQAMKKGSPTPAAAEPAAAAPKPARKKPGRKPGQTAVTAAPSPARKPAAAAPQGGLADHAEAIKKAVEELGGDQVRKLTGLFE
jgi:hypothetical protein